MMGRAALAVLLGSALLAAAGCPKPPTEITGRGRGTRSGQAPRRNVDDVVRDLEASVIELYAQRGSKRVGGFADSLARKQQLTLFGTAAEDLAQGRYRRVLRRLRRGARRGNRHLPFSDAAPQVLFKGLELHTSPDKSIAWLFDEVSYRITRDGKQAAIPLRVTALFMLDIDRWTLVMEHVSYALPMSEILRLARSHSLRSPPRLSNYSAVRGPGAQLVRIIKRLHNGQSVSGGDDGGKFRLRKLSQGEAAMAIWPARGQEFRGERVANAPMVSTLFGAGHVDVRGYRVVVAPTGKHAWMAATLRVRVSEDGQELEIPLRATYVFELNAAGWQVVQTHLSVPIADVQLSDRLFGPAVPSTGG